MILLNKTSCNHKVYKGQIALGDTKFKFIFSSTGSNLNYSWYTDPPSYSSKEEHRLDWSKGEEGFFFRITFKSKFWKINTLQYYWLTFISSSIQTNAHTFLSIANVANNFPSGENAKDMGNVLHWKNFKKRIFIKWFLTPNSSPWNAKRAMHSPTCTYRVHWACYKFSSLANLPVCTDAPHP